MSEWWSNSNRSVAARPGSKGSQTSLKAFRAPQSFSEIDDPDDSNCTLPQDAKHTYVPRSLSSKVCSKPPETVVMCALRWLLFNQPVFTPGHDVTTESSYLRTRGARSLKWRTDATFRAVHAVAAEAVEFAEEPLGFVKTWLVWAFIVASALVAALGSVIARNRACTLALLAIALLFVHAVIHVWRARRFASIQMARCAFERERAHRMRSPPPLGSQPDVIVHHVVLSFLEDVLEFCKYGELPEVGISHQRGLGERTASICADAAAAVGLRGNPDCSSQGFNHLERDKCNDCSLWVGMHAFTRWCTGEGHSFGTLCSPDGYVNKNVGVPLFKYNWQTDATLRMASVAKTEWKMCSSLRFGRYCCAVAFAGMLPAVLLLLGSSALITTGRTYVYIPAIVTSSLIFVISLVVLWRRLPMWMIVDGLIREAQEHLESGEEAFEDVDEVTQVTDLAVRALEFSLMAMNDRGELQSCEYWPLPFDGHPSGSCKGFEGQDATTLTPPERSNLQGHQISIQLQYDSAELHRMQPNSTPNDMVTHTDALALSDSRHASGRSMQAYPTNTSPPDRPQQDAHHGALFQHASHRTSQKQQLQPGGGGHGLEPAHVPEPSLFHLASTEHSRQPSLGIQSLPCNVSGTAQIAASKLLPSATVLAAGVQEDSQQMQVPDLFSLLPKSRSLRKQSSARCNITYASISNESAAEDLFDDEEEPTALLPGAAVAELLVSAAANPLFEEQFSKCSDSQRLSAEDPVISNPMLPSSTHPAEGASGSSAIFVTALGTPVAASGNPYFSWAVDSMHQRPRTSTTPESGPFLCDVSPGSATSSAAGWRLDPNDPAAPVREQDSNSLMQTASPAFIGASQAVASTAEVGAVTTRTGFITVPSEAELAGGYSAGIDSNTESIMHS